GRGGAVGAVGLGGLLMRMALMLRLVRCDWGGLHPQLLFNTIVRAGTPYLMTAAAIASLFLPALICAVTVTNSRIYLTLSMVGPLLVAPIFVAARLLGRLVDPEGERLGAFAPGSAGAPAPTKDEGALGPIAQAEPHPARP